MARGLAEGGLRNGAYLVVCCANIKMAKLQSLPAPCASKKGVGE